MARRTVGATKAQSKKKSLEKQGSPTWGAAPIARSRDEIALSQMDASEVALRRDFSARLVDRLNRERWNGAELARRSGLGRDAISRYIRGTAIPYRSSLEKIAAALNCQPDDLIPPAAHNPTKTILPETDMQSAEPGMAWVRVNKKLPWELALKIMKLANSTE